MANPAHTARVVPPAGSYKVPEGFKTTKAFSLKNNVKFWEQSVQPIGFDAGEAINTTTQLNSVWRTKYVPILKEGTNTRQTCFYDPDVYSDVIGTLLGNNGGAVSDNMPDGTSIDYYGALKSFIPKENKEKEAALADYEVVPTMWDLQNQLEVGPVVTAAAGT